MPKNDRIMVEYFDLPNPSIRSYFGRVERGNSEIYRTTFYKGKDQSVVLRKWFDQLKSIKTEWPTLLQYESDLMSKVGPLSVMKPLAERMEDIYAYYDCINQQSKPLASDAVEAFKTELKGCNTLQLRGIDKTIENMKLSTNSGTPFFNKRRNDVRRHRIGPVVHTHDGHTSMLIDGKEWPAAAILGWRGQEGGPKPEDVKQRVVWMFPFNVNVQELRCYQPMIEMFQKQNIVPAWISMDKVDESITKLFDTKGPDDLIICTDFSKFDQHFNSDCQTVSRDIISWLFKSDPRIEGWLKDVYPVKFDIPIIYSENLMKSGPHGMASGSGGTNADETILHRVLQYEAALSVGKTLNPNSQCLGDDGILSYPGCKVEDVMRTYTSHGQEMNPSKQYVSTQDCTYLRRWHHKDYRENGICVGVYGTTRALGRLMYQERYYDPDKWSNKMVALRQLSILENCKYHPLKELFVDYCMKGDKYRLGVDIPGFLDNLDKLVEEATDYIPDFLGYTKSLQSEGSRSLGINDWWIVKYLKSKA